MTIGVVATQLPRNALVQRSTTSLAARLRLNGGLGTGGHDGRKTFEHTLDKVVTIELTATFQALFTHFCTARVGPPELLSDTQLRGQTACTTQTLMSGRNKMVVHRPR